MAAPPTGSGRRPRHEMCVHMRRFVYYWRCMHACMRSRAGETCMGLACVPRQLAVLSGSVGQPPRARKLAGDMHAYASLRLCMAAHNVCLDCHRIRQDWTVPSRCRCFIGSQVWVEQASGFLVACSPCQVERRAKAGTVEEVMATSIGIISCLSINCLNHGK